MLAATIVGVGVVISGMSIAAIAHQEQRPQMAQATQPLQSTPGADSKPSEPAPTTGTSGVRPHDVAPQPARPDADAQKSGASPALPPAPAEKSAEPIPTR